MKLVHHWLVQFGTLAVAVHCAFHMMDGLNALCFAILTHVFFERLEHRALQRQIDRYERLKREIAESQSIFFAHVHTFWRRARERGWQ